ncbi:MAG: hypothetical protein Q7S21_04380 [archaeon]|nr:hypothetical protein [archaeon]
MEIGKIFSAVKIPFIVSLLLTLLGIGISYMSLSSKDLGSLATFALVATALGIIGLAVAIWVGYAAAKGTSGAWKEGAIAGILVGLITGIISIILNMVLIWPLYSQLGSALGALGAGIGLVAAIIALIIGLIIAAILGAIGGYIGRAK